MPAHTFHDLIDGCQSDPSSSAYGFRSKKRIEYPLQCRLVHTDSAVRNLHQNIFSRADRESGILLPVQWKFTRCQLQTAALRHRIAGIDDQIHKYLVNLTGSLTDQS